ncbi:hypothetical protein MNBD_CHLOROFLEXI01-1173 [hydrothermal vent metagenome]|uniref:Lipoprotein n=1 Tax=hydrothermal vent metagenome TaxID=652676 RepID=A0A3B0V4V1_9ZZZZ
MMLTQPKQRQIQHMILGFCCLLTLLLTACRSVSSTIDVKAEIEPEPIVGEIVTLRIEVVSEKFSGDGEINIQMLGEINFVAGSPEWQKTLVTHETSTGSQTLEIFVWRGHIEANEPQIQEVSICVTQPGEWGISLNAGTTGLDGGGGDVDGTRLHIISTADSAQVIPSSDYKGPQRSFSSTPLPTPMPVTVSVECSGEG